MNDAELMHDRPDVSEGILHSVSAFIYEELAALDERRWDDWLTCFAPDAEYWVPAWDSELEQTDDPQTQISLIYYPTRTGLADRIFRIRTNQSSASTPLPRTCHMISNIRVTAAEFGLTRVRASWQVSSYRFDQTTTYYGFYDYLLIRISSKWHIQKKKIILLNDTIPNILDIYSV